MAHRREERHDAPPALKKGGGAAFVTSGPDFRATLASEPNVQSLQLDPRAIGDPVLGAEGLEW